MKPIMIPRRFAMSATKYSTNIGMVVSSGAPIVQMISLAIEILASLYSASPNSSSLFDFFC